MAADSGSLSRGQSFAVVALCAMVVLAVPLYVLVGFLTAPLGLGVIMLVNDSPWVLNLYPFIFAGKMHSANSASFFLGNTIGYLLTLVQWVVLAGLFARRVDDTWPRGKILGQAAILVAAVAIASWIVLHLLGMQAVWTQGAHT
ncbi:hypothetical protein G4G28_21935 [Massilia sp. Dwa41.01b]|uniref:hypothetical protein n=1 Tax=unclassified Massilia TaxID=2609279 RepID=UPI0015FF8524|nr:MULTISPECIES: hypothetical protein [unclassified Massilia]QNA90495.1 hypothetical protein G4G28_21935 [Massilia sp. Dwa41.01b]QNA97725.1 hypothetical protein G4G31_01015 [Massilia sp. Se16.2.3]